MSVSSSFLDNPYRRAVCIKVFWNDINPAFASWKLTTLYSGSDKVSTVLTFHSVYQMSVGNIFPTHVLNGLPEKFTYKKCILWSPPFKQVNGMTTLGSVTLTPVIPLVPSSIPIIRHLWLRMCRFYPFKVGSFYKY